nr:pseudouridine synthase [Alsobacter ponti]
MSDKTKKGGGGSKGRPPASRGARPTSGGPGARGDKPFRRGPDERAPRGDRPREARAPRDDRPRQDRPREDRPRDAGPPRERPNRDNRPAGEGRAPREGFRPGGPRGDRPAGGRGGFGGRAEREGGERPFRARSAEGDARRARPDDRPAQGGERPFRARRDDRPAQGDAPRGRRDDRPAQGGERPFRARRDDRPAQGGERPFRARRDDRPAQGGERPFRARRADRPAQGGERPFRARRDERPARGEASPVRARREDAARGSRVNAPKPRGEVAERIAKVMARAGLCSRRDAEAWIEAGRVTVNGQAISSPALDVTPSDAITVDGQKLPSRERTRLFLFHKPRGLVTTARDPEGRTTVFERLPRGLPRVVAVGRLDINTEGLLLLTNDGGLSRVLELPETGWLRRYRVRAFGGISQDRLDALAAGVTIDGMHYGPVDAALEREKGDNVWLTIGLREGKNREVKRILEHLGLQVNRLIRVSYGPFQLGNLPEGEVEEVRTRVLADQLGDELAEQAQVDFEAPVFVYDEDEEDRPAVRTRPPAPRQAAPRQAAPREERRESRHEDRGRDRGDERRERPARAPREGFRERPERGRDAGREHAEERPRPPRRHPTEPLRSVWRAEDTEAMAPKGKIPRRGADPKLARAEGADKPRKRGPDVTDRRGRAVQVERVPRDPASEIREPARRPARPRADAPAETTAAPRRNLWTEDAAPRARAERPDDRPSRPRGERPGGERPGSERPRGERPRGERPAGGRSFGDRPGGFKPRGDRPGGERQGGDRPGGDRPSRNGKPGSRPQGAGGKPRGPGGPRPGGGGGARPRPPRAR